MKHNYLKSLFLMLMMCVGMSAWAEDVTFSLGTTSGKDISSSSGTTKSNITVSFANGSGTALSWQTDHVRFYHNGSKVTISSTSTNITKIVVIAKSGYASADLKVGTTSLKSNDAKTEYTYTPGSPTNTVTISNDGSAQARLTSIVVTTNEKVSYTLETIGEGTTTFKDASGNIVAPGQKVNSGTKITPTFKPADGYEFTSWEYYTTVGSWSNVSDTEFTISKDVKFRVTYTADTPKAKYPVTILTPENGSLTIKDGSTTINNGDEVEEGKTLTVEVAPTNGYRFKTWGYKDGDANWVGNVTSTFTHVMPSAPCSFKATFEEIPTYTVAFSVNGTIVKSDRLQEGSAVTAPADPDAINGKVFTGWIETATVVGETPAYVTPSATATKTVTYYAVFADLQQGDAQIITDKLTQEWTESTGTTYADWSNKTLLSGTVYTGKTAGSYSSIQLRNNSTGKNPTYDGIITTKSGGKAKKVSVEWNSSTASGRTLNVYGKNQAYSAVKDVFDEDKYGTLIGTIVYGTSTTLSIDGDYDFIALASNSGAMYLNSISIDWEKGTPNVYSDFTTTPNSAEEEKSEITIGKYGYSTYYTDKAYVMPEGLTGLTVSANDGGNLTLTEKYQAKKVVPANTPLILKGEQNTYTLTYTNETGADAGENYLRGKLTRGIIEAESGDYYYYKLTTGPSSNSEYAGKLGFYWGEANGGVFEMKNDNRAYLVLPKSANVKAFTFDDFETAIQSVETNKYDTKIFNLQGQRVDKAQKGIYIINGRKVVK